MRFGLIARSEDRGLGILTWEAFRALEPDRTLLVDMGDLARGFPAHPERFPDAETARFDGQRFVDVDRIRKWLSGLDVVYSAETFYDWRVVEWAREVGCRTVVHVMPEFWKHASESLPVPDAWWVPTVWRRDHMPADARLVPVPVAMDRFAGYRPARPDSKIRFLHVAGHAAAADRAGTQIVLRACRLVHEPMTVVLRTQDVRLPQIVPPGRHVEIRYEQSTVCDYWESYRGADVLVQPRRYGGLSLPLNEGAAAGLALVMPDVEPHRLTWPGIYVPGQTKGSLATAAGPLALFETDPAALASTMDLLASRPQVVEDAAAAAWSWAKTHSWERLRGQWLVELDRICRR